METVRNAVLCFSCIHDDHNAVGTVSGRFWAGRLCGQEWAKLATQMTYVILDDNSFIFASHLKMSIVSGEGVTG